jgi:hypothetical protein
MEVECGAPDGPLGTRDRLVLEAMQHCYRLLELRAHWSSGHGIAKRDFTWEELLEDWMILVSDVRREVETATIFNDEIPRADWPDIPACLVLATQAFLEGEMPTRPPPPVAVETWQMVSRFLAMGLIEERRDLMGRYLEGYIKRHKADGRIGPAFHPEQVPPQETSR